MLMGRMTRCLLAASLAVVVVSPGLSGRASVEWVGTYRFSVPGRSLNVDYELTLASNGEAVVTSTRAWIEVATGGGRSVLAIGDVNGRGQFGTLPTPPPWTGTWRRSGSAASVEVACPDRPLPWAFDLRWDPRSRRPFGVRGALLAPWWTPRGWIDPADAGVGDRRVPLEPVNEWRQGRAARALP